MKQLLESSYLLGAEKLSKVNQSLRTKIEGAKNLALRVYNNATAEEKKGPSVEEQIKAMREEILAEIAKQLTSFRQGLRLKDSNRDLIMFELTLDEETSEHLWPRIDCNGLLGVSVKPDRLPLLFQNPQLGVVEKLEIRVGSDNVEQTINALLENQSKLIGLQEIAFTYGELKRSDVKHLAKLTELPTQLPLKRIQFWSLTYTESIERALKQKLAKRFSFALRYSHPD